MRGSPLDVLLLDGVIEEVLGRLNSGKEADIYLVQHNGRVVAAKVYRDRQHRSFHNNADYKEGRAVRNTRTQRAMDTGSRFGRQAAEDAWGTAEARALHQLHAGGVRVPVPVMSYEGVLLMELVTDAEGEPAPRLIEVSYDPATARAVYTDLRGQIVRMLCAEVVHGDLSPYNILAAAGGPTIIDFPQMVSAAHNSRAEYFFQRDFSNVLNFLAGFDRSLQALSDDGRRIWTAYCRRELTPEYVPTAAPFRRDDSYRRAPLPSRSPAPGQPDHPVGNTASQGRPRHPHAPAGTSPHRPQGNPNAGPRPQGNPNAGPRPQGNPGGGQRRSGGPGGGQQRPQGNPNGGQRPQGGPAVTVHRTPSSSTPRSAPSPDRVFRSPDLPPRGPVSGREEAAPAPSGSHRRRPKRRF